VVVVCLLSRETLTRIIHNQMKNKFNTLSLLCDSGSGDIAFGRSSLRSTELSQSTSGCGNRCAKAKPPLCATGISRDMVYASHCVIYCGDIWLLTASVATPVETALIGTLFFTQV
jgi:hypothetical protein